jgi:protein TonB
VWDKVDSVLPARSIPADPPPPPPTAEPSVPADNRPLVAPKPAVDLNRNSTSATIIELVPLPQPSALPTTPAADPLPLEPSPTPSFQPKAASPLGHPGRWATSADYPARALREEREGTTRFRVIVGADGRVKGCEVTASSGSPDLDAATCANVAMRARFSPATDESGARVAGSYSSAVRWEIPD